MKYEIIVPASREKVQGRIQVKIVSKTSKGLKYH